MKAASYSETFVHVYRNAFCEKRKDFNIIKAAHKLLQRTKMGRHTVVFELTGRHNGRHTVVFELTGRRNGRRTVVFELTEKVMGDIQWCLN